MIKILKREILTFPKIDKKKILTIAEVENKSVKRVLYYLGFLSGNREDKKHLISKKVYERERSFALNVETKIL